MGLILQSKIQIVIKRNVSKKLSELKNQIKFTLQENFSNTLRLYFQSKVSFTPENTKKNEISENLQVYECFESKGNFQSRAV